MKMKLLAVCWLISLASACGADREQRSIAQTVLSDRHDICIPTDGVRIEDREEAADYDYGTIVDNNGTTVPFYVSSEPGRIGVGMLVSTTDTRKDSTQGRDIHEEIFADGTHSLRVDGFPSRIRGGKALHVKFYFAPEDGAQSALANVLILGAGNCAPGDA